MVRYKLGLDINVVDEPWLPYDPNDAINGSSFQIRIVRWRSPSASGFHRASFGELLSSLLYVISN